MEKEPPRGGPFDAGRPVSAYQPIVYVTVVGAFVCSDGL
jgi:hypothetical protein